MLGFKQGYTDAGVGKAGQCMDFTQAWSEHGARVMTYLSCGCLTTGESPRPEWGKTGCCIGKMVSWCRGRGSSHPVRCCSLHLVGPYRQDVPHTGCPLGRPAAENPRILAHTATESALTSELKGAALTSHLCKGGQDIIAV